MEELTSRRDGIDVELAERRSRENAALERWVRLTVRREEIETALDGELARLENERTRVRGEATQRAAEVEADRAALLLELNRDGRTVDQLATLVGLPIKQMRTMLREAKAREKPTATPEPAREEPGAEAGGPRPHAAGREGSGTATGAPPPHADQPPAATDPAPSGPVRPDGSPSLEHLRAVEEAAAAV